MFILYAIVGRELCGHPQSMEESAYLWWLQLNMPSMLTEKGRKFVTDHVPPNVIDNLRSISKGQFFYAFQEVRRRGTRLGKPRLVVE